ncbi:MAG: hypothetical protein LUD72_01805, partial [Bacteroidales bacterium]|nr:hypothetical protein [Bacteroidales bacterium]
FSTDGLEAEVKRESGNKETISASYLDVDYSDFDNTKAGEYDIVVSYTEDDVTLTQSYGVEVIEEITGMMVEKTTVDYAITDVTGAEIKLDDMKVYSVTGESEAIRELSSGEYELKYFKGGDEITSLSGLSAGVYTIYAYRDVEISGKYSNISYECGAYVLVYVSDSLVSLTFNEEGAVVTQDLSSEDTMTGTWTFTLTYESGIEKNLTIDDVAVTNLNTARPAADGESATVTYTEKYYVSADEEREDKSVSTKVEYTITIPVGGVTLEYEWDSEEMYRIAGFNEESEITNTTLDASWFTGSNAFMTYNGSNNSSDNCLRTSGSYVVLAIKQNTISVTFYGTGTLEIAFMSTNSGSNTSTLAVSNANGDYIKGEAATEGDEKFAEHAYSKTGGGEADQYVYEVTANTPKTVTYNIATPGTYTIHAYIGYKDESGNAVSAPNRAAYITSIKMIDHVDDGLSELSHYDSLDTEMTETTILENATSLNLCACCNVSALDAALPEGLSGFENGDVLGKERK